MDTLEKVLQENIALEFFFSFLAGVAKGLRIKLSIGMASEI